MKSIKNIIICVGIALSVNSSTLKSEIIKSPVSGVQAKASSLTDFYIHEDPLTKKYVYHFTGNPTCSYIPKAIDKKSLESGKPITLSFFCPLASIKNGVGKQAIEKKNKEACAADHCVKVKMVNAPMKGIQYDIVINPEKGGGVKHMSFVSITGKKGFMFEFYKRDALKKVNIKTSSNRLRRLAYTEKPKVIIDCGHGGKDPGYNKGALKEKDINLAIGQNLSSLLKKKGYQVCLTRKGDESLALDERTARIRSCPGAHALVSIHTNSAPHSNKVSGIETFCHKEDLFTVNLNKISPQLIAKADQVDKFLFSHSNQLAHSIHKQVLGHAQKKQTNVVDRKVQHKVSQMLLGSGIPSVLLELGFLTNQKEATLLQNKSYQKLLAQGISKGLDEFFNVM